MSKICKNCLLLICSLVLLLQTSSQMSTFKASKNNKCPDTPRPVNKSIKACWNYTKKLEMTLIDKTDVKRNLCLDANSKYDNHQLGAEIMRTSKIIYCFGIVKGNKFNKEEFTYPINGIMQTKSEIMENPYICVLDGDYKDPSCRQIDYSDYNVMYKAIMEQSRMLEGLFIGTHSSV